MVSSMRGRPFAAGADGLIIETHNDPQHALCDGGTEPYLARLSMTLWKTLQDCSLSVGREL